jgi:hypothetical protein
VPGDEANRAEEAGGARALVGPDRCLERSRLAQDEALATGEGHLCPVLQHKDIAHQVDYARMLDVFEINDAIAPGAKELCGVEPLFAIAKRSTDEHGGADPVNTTVISLRFKSKKVGHPENATLDVIGEHNEIVITKRNVSGELVNNFPWFGTDAIRLVDGADSTSVFFRELWLVA